MRVETEALILSIVTFDSAALRAIPPPTMSSTPSLPTTPVPSAFTLMTGRAKSIATQVDEALAEASPNDETVSDLCKIVWKDRRFVLGNEWAAREAVPGPILTLDHGSC